MFAVSSLHCEVRGALFYNPPKKRNLIKPIMSQPAFSPQKENMYKYEGLELPQGFSIFVTKTNLILMS